MSCPLIIINRRAIAPLPPNSRVPNYLVETIMTICYVTHEITQKLSSISSSVFNESFRHMSNAKFEKAAIDLLGMCVHN